MDAHPSRQLLDLYRSGGRGVLVTVVRGDGTGTRMLALNSGDRAGHTFDVEISTVTLLASVRTEASRELLQEDACTQDAAALIDAMEAALAGSARTVVTVLPTATHPLQRFIMDNVYDVLFATESLETEDLVPLRRTARGALHGSLHPTPQGRIFVETLQLTEAGDFVTREQNDRLAGGR